MNKVDEYLDEVCLCIRAKSVHAAVRDELYSHIQEIIDAGISAGLPPEEAEKQALVHMGDPEEIGVELDKKHRPKTEWTLLLAAAVIALAGIAVSMNVSEGIYWAKSVFILIGYGLMVGVMFVNPIWLRRLALPVYLVFAVTAAVFDYHWWAWSARAIFGLVFMPGFIQLAPVLFMGLMFRRESFTAFQTAGLCVLMALPTINACLCGKMSGIVLDGLSFIFIFGVLSVKRNKTARILLPASAALSGLELWTAFLIMPHIQDNIAAFMTGGHSDPRGLGWLTVQLEELLKNARLIGPAPGGVLEIFANPMSEYALAGLLDRFGWIPVIALLLVIAVLLWRLFAAAAKVKAPYGFALALAASVELAVKFLVNILINFNLFPAIDIGLPIVGGGGSDCIVTFILLGLALSACRWRDLTTDSVPVRALGMAFWRRAFEK